MPKAEVTAYMCMPPPRQLTPAPSPPRHTHISNQSHSLCVCVCFVCVLQEVHGWYYLLGEDLGRKKHLKVPPQHDCRSNGNFIMNKWATCAEGIKSWKKKLKLCRNRILRYLNAVYYFFLSSDKQMVKKAWTTFYHR